MKADIDQKMEEAALEALFVAGPASHNASMVYFTGLVHLTSAYLLKKRGEPPVVFHRPMERDEASQTGLKTKNLEDYETLRLLEQVGGDHNRAQALLFQRIFEDFGVEGRVGVYGKVEIGPYQTVLRLLQEAMPGVEIVGESKHDSVLTRARATKDEEEVARMRKMGQITTSVVADVAGFLRAHQVQDGVLVNREGQVLTVGEVKRRVKLWLAMRGADDHEGCIFAVGRDAGVPHSAGTDADPVPVGKNIIFDLFPCEAGGGYYYDFTRTWCLGYAPEEVLQVYQDVLAVYETMLASFEPQAYCRDLQRQACELFEERGHATIRQDSASQEGYVHNLAHGLGLDVHEAPSFSHVESNADRLLPGTIFTHEPGLYYPERELGVRIEDTVWLRPEGGFEVLAEYPKDLVLELPGL